jgi:hypothetical protein
LENFTVRRYQADDRSRWDTFADCAKNATFLFRRGFMEYHADRFSDHSLLVFKNDKLLGIMPAHVSGNEVFSHNGLTYGSLAYADGIRTSEVIGMLGAVLKFLHQSGIERLHLKCIPSIYHLKPADELLYALFAAGASLARRDVLSVIDLEKPYKISKTRKESIRRGQKNGLEIIEDNDFDTFWNDILIPNLRGKHGVTPVHTLSEIKLLHARFPENIRHFNVYHKGRIVAGTTVFVSAQVAHPQYISAQQDKNRLGSLDFLYHHLVAGVFRGKRYFDFGISNENQGMKLNESLAFWKESYGASAIAQDFYSVETSAFAKLDHVLI